MLGCNQDNTETTLSTAPGALAIRCGANARVTDNVPKKWDSSEPGHHQSTRREVLRGWPSRPLSISSVTSLAIAAAASTDDGSVMSMWIGMTPGSSLSAGGCGTHGCEGATHEWSFRPVVSFD
jgi:hypothetical protein